MVRLDTSAKVDKGISIWLKRANGWISPVASGGAFSLNRWRWLTALEENDSIARRRRFRICCFSSMIRVRRLWLLYFWLLRVVLPLLWRPPRRNADHPSSAVRLPGDRRAAQLSIGGGFLHSCGLFTQLAVKGPADYPRISIDSIHWPPIHFIDVLCAGPFPFIAAAVFAHHPFVSIIDDLRVFGPKCFTPGVEFFFI